MRKPANDPRPARAKVNAAQVVGSREGTWACEDGVEGPILRMDVGSITRTLSWSSDFDKTATMGTGKKVSAKRAATKKPPAKKPAAKTITVAKPAAVPALTDVDAVASKAE
jgi:hypothetical protein